MITYIATLIIGLTVLFGGGLVANKGNVTNTVKEFSNILKLSKETPTPTASLPTEEPTPYLTPTPAQEITNQQLTNTSNNVGNQIDCVGPDQKTFKTTMAACEKLNRDWGKEPDYMVNCGIHSKCGGGSVWISNSACNNTICCTYSDGRNVFLYDKNQCKSNITNYTYPTYSPLPTSKPWPTSAPFPTYAPLPTIAPYIYVPPTTSPDQCRSQVISTYAPLLQSCSQYGGTSAYSACIQIYSSERDAAYSQCGN